MSENTITTLIKWREI